MSGLCRIGLGEQILGAIHEIFKSNSYLQEQISNAEVAVHAGDHEGRAEVPLHAVHVHLRPQSQLRHDVQVAHACRQDQCCEPIFVG